MTDWRDSVIHWLCGGIAGCCGKSSTAPLDRVKILFQTRNPHYVKDQTIGIYRTLRTIYTEEGIRGLWKGNSATLWRVFPYASFQFLSYENYKKFLLPQNSSKPHPFMHMVCGSLAGTTATLLTYPLDIVRARMAAQNFGACGFFLKFSPEGFTLLDVADWPLTKVHTNVYTNVFQALMHMYRQEGARGWFKGLVPTVQGIIPYAGVNFSTFETLKHYAPKDDKGNLTVPWRIICGGIAGPTGQTVSYPWDVVRRRKQTWGFSPGTADLGNISTTETFRRIVATEGWLGLWKGISINYWKATPTTAVAFTIYETLSIFLKKQAHKNDPNYKISPSRRGLGGH